MPNSKIKGNIFETSACKTISLFLTSGERDDLFWRSSNSGGRQTVRARQGKETYNQAGDLTTTHPDGEMFMSVFVIECKHHKDINLWSLITDTENQTLLGWWKTHVKKAEEVSKIPLLIVRQNHKPILWISNSGFRKMLEDYFAVSYKLKVKCGEADTMYIYSQDMILNLDPVQFNHMLQG